MVSSPNRGFTIVELLIVVVIIAILAAITIVAYNNIQGRSRTSSAQAAATSAIKKAITYHTETGAYPTASSVLTGAASTTTYRLAGTTFDGTALSSGNLPLAPSELNFYKCGTGASTAAPATAADVTTQTGVRIDYWNYTTAAIGNMSSGIVSPALIGTNNVGCALSA